MIYMFVNGIIILFKPIINTKHIGDILVFWFGKICMDFIYIHNKIMPGSDSQQHRKQEDSLVTTDWRSLYSWPNFDELMEPLKNEHFKLIWQKECSQVDTRCWCEGWVTRYLCLNPFINCSKNIELSKNVNSCGQFK